MKYRKKPVVIEAFRLKDKSRPKWFTGSVTVDNRTLEEAAIIETLEGTMIALEEDYIIKGVQGEIYPCKPDIFEQTYEKVE
jgi:hypothetical protein